MRGTHGVKYSLLPTQQVFLLSSLLTDLCLIQDSSSSLGKNHGQTWNLPHFARGWIKGNHVTWVWLRYEGSWERLLALKWLPNKKHVEQTNCALSSWCLYVNIEKAVDFLGPWRSWPRRQARVLNVAEKKGEIYGFIMLVGRRRQWHPTPVLLPGKSHGPRSLVGCSPWDWEEPDTTERLHFHLSLSCIGKGNGNPLQCSCLENPRDGGAWWVAVYGVAKSQTRLKRPSSSSSSRISFLSPQMIFSK